jgi:hypothetical protein
MSRPVSLSVVVVALLVLPALPIGLGTAFSSVGAVRSPHVAPSAATTGTPFAAVTNFEDLHLDGWSPVLGTATITTTVEYEGEPSLASTGLPTSGQIDRTSRHFVTGDAALSFQVAIDYAAGGTGFVGLSAHGSPVAVVGVGNGSVWAGATPGSATSVATIPTSGTAQPSGWVVLMVNVNSTHPAAPQSWPWLMSVYVDRTDVAASTSILLPGAGNYTGAFIDTTHGTLYYTNLIFTTYQIPITVPGYNNMDGYGQGSALLVSLLPAFTTLSANLTLSNWSVPQGGILGTQINAMNRVGTTVSTCRGFFQLGVDLNPNGKIAPWYVPGVNCVATYFATNSTSSNGGFHTPVGSRLGLSITDNRASNSITFRIVDYSVTGADRYWNATIAYVGSEFFGAYTQLEWQPCCSSHPIASYFFNGTFSHLRIDGGNVTAPRSLSASYMLPFVLDAPPSWNFGYYDATTASYSQVG